MAEKTADDSGIDNNYGCAVDSRIAFEFRDKNIFAYLITAGFGDNFDKMVEKQEIKGLTPIRG